MKKLLSLVAILGVALVLTSYAKAAENWSLSGDYTITLTCTSGCTGDYIHTMNISLYDNDDGTFSGTGYRDALPSQTWTVSGDITGDTLSYTVDYNGSAYYVNATGTIAFDGTMSGEAVSSSSQKFDWVMSPKASFNRYAEIDSPEVDEHVYGNVVFTAHLLDKDDNDVFFAIRKNSCSGTDMWANVGSRSDTFEWEKEGEFTYNFSTTPDTTNWGEGKYCFVFRVRKAGAEDIRLTRTFYIDDDGVYGSEDLCPGTLHDPIEGLGVNRHVWYGGKYFTTLLPPKKNKVEAPSGFSIEDTYGCSCTQILDLIKDASGDEMLGHYKFGCSKSIIEDFILDMNDGELDGKYLLDKFDVPGDDETGIYSNITTTHGAQYLLEASGTYKFAKYWTVGGIADAMYSLRPDGTWLLGSELPVPYTDFLSLRVDGNPVTWAGTYTDPEHIYTLDYIGTGNPIHFNIFDGGTIGDNSGSLHVKIFVEL